MCPDTAPPHAPALAAPPQGACWLLCGWGATATPTSVERTSPLLLTAPHARFGTRARRSRWAWCCGSCFGAKRPRYFGHNNSTKRHLVYTCFSFISRGQAPGPPASGWVGTAGKASVGGVKVKGSIPQNQNMAYKTRLPATAAPERSANPGGAQRDGGGRRTTPRPALSAGGEGASQRQLSVAQQSISRHSSSALKDPRPPLSIPSQGDADGDAPHGFRPPCGVHHC